MTQIKGANVFLSWQKKAEQLLPTLNERDLGVLVDSTLSEGSGEQVLRGATPLGTPELPGGAQLLIRLVLQTPHEPLLGTCSP